jgi:hypothetical protein
VKIKAPGWTVAERNRLTKNYCHPFKFYNGLLAYTDFEYRLFLNAWECWKELIRDDHEFYLEDQLVYKIERDYVRGKANELPEEAFEEDKNEKRVENQYEEGSDGMMECSDEEKEDSSESASGSLINCAEGNLPEGAEKVECLETGALGSRSIESGNFAEDERSLCSLESFFSWSSAGDDDRAGPSRQWWENFLDEGR